MAVIDDILAEPAARRLALARDAADALAASGWRMTYAAVHSGGTADLAAERTRTHNKLAARVRLIIHCDSRQQRFVLSSLDAPITDRLPFYSLGDDDPAQRRALAATLDPDLIAQIHAAAYPRAIALTERAQIDAPPARAHVAAISDQVLDEAFASADAVRRDLLQHDLDVIRDDADIDRDFAAHGAIDAAHRCELLYPIVITDAELRSIPDKKRHDWLRVERTSLVGHQRQWIDLVHGAAFAHYADALTRHISAAYRKRRFAPADASSRS